MKPDDDSGPGRTDGEPDDDPRAAGTSDVGTIKSRARRGVLALIVRAVAIQLAQLGGMVILARLLSPEDFGVFAIVKFVLTFFQFFGDAGLGAALIQQPDPPSQGQLRSIFTVQLLFSLLIIGLVWVLAPQMGLLWDDLPAAAVWLMRAISVSLLLTSLRVVPSILMERELLFGRLSVVEVLQNIGFYLAACLLAFAGLGIWALIAGVLAQGLVGLVGAYVARPWRPGLALDPGRLGPLVRFGLAFQVKHIVGFINGAVVPVYAGARLGIRAVGFIQWAMDTAFFPLKVVEIMSRVAFPLFSRLQHDRRLLAGSLERSVHLCAVVTLFMVGLYLGIGPSFVQVIFTAKWMPGLPLLYIFALMISIGFLSPLLAPALDATGRPQVFAYLAIGWTVLNWIVVPITSRWGQIGFVSGYAVHVVVGNIAVIIVLLRLIPDAHLWRRVRAPLVGGGVIALVGHHLLAASGPATLTGIILLLLAIYLGLVYLLDGAALRDALSIVPGGDDDGRPPRGASDEGDHGQR